ncbi:MAG: hypothetical protein JNJ92_06870 [Altererythrobacter sp.]|nr:hypothetical protein [Altererythrobacter sp.]
MPILLDTSEQIVNIMPIAGTDSANRSYPINRDVPVMARAVKRPPTAWNRQNDERNL